MGNNMIYDCQYKDLKNLIRKLLLEQGGDTDNLDFRSSDISISMLDDLYKEFMASEVSDIILQQVHFSDLKTIARKMLFETGEFCEDLELESSKMAQHMMKSLYKEHSSDSISGAILEVARYVDEH